MLIIQYIWTYVHVYRVIPLKENNMIPDFMMWLTILMCMNENSDNKVRENKHTCQNRGKINNDRELISIDYKKILIILSVELIWVILLFIIS